MKHNPLQPLADHLVDLQSDRDTAMERSRELAEQIATLLARKDRLEAEIDSLREAMAGQAPSGPAAVGDEGLEPPTPSV